MQDRLFLLAALLSRLALFVQGSLELGFTGLVRLVLFLLLGLGEVSNPIMHR